MALAKLKGAKRALLLSVSAPFHCTLMRPAAEAMAEALTAGAAAGAPAAARRQCSARARSAIPRRFATVWSRRSPARCAGARASPLWPSRASTRFVEIGAGKVLTGLVKRIAAGASTLSVGAPDDVAAFKNAAAG